MTVNAYAKINWTLHVLGTRPDGYHDLESIVLPVALHDVITIEEDSSITCETVGLDVPQEKNLAYRAAVALRDATGCTRGARISIRKNIPSGAGLVGGSSDAACTTIAGVPTVCSCGAMGEWNHTVREYIAESSLCQRAKLFAAAVLRLDEFRP